MTSFFSNCYDCNNDNNINIIKKYNEYLHIQFILMSLNIPKEISQKIIKLSNNYNNCSYCNKILCFEHTERGKVFAKLNRTNGIMCDICCWHGIV